MSHSPFNQEECFLNTEIEVTLIHITTWGILPPPGNLAFIPTGTTWKIVVAPENQRGQIGSFRLFKLMRVEGRRLVFEVDGFPATYLYANDISSLREQLIYQTQSPLFRGDAAGPTPYSVGDPWEEISVYKPDGCQVTFKEVRHLFKELVEKQSFDWRKHYALPPNQVFNSRRNPDLNFDLVGPRWLGWMG
ncbi:MAG: hypothetical protein MMC33_009843 [Icmadophila ericetorum]|nr:hypothetical protein [Icmadophila ericetorum]